MFEKNKKKTTRIHFECWFEPFSLSGKDNCTDEQLAEQYAKMILNQISDYKKKDTSMKYFCRIEQSNI